MVLVAEASPDCFVHRVSALPLVSYAAQRALCGYEKTKNYNGLLGATLSVLEHSVRYAAGKAEPVYTRLEKPLQAAGRVACRGLDHLEESYPAVVHATPEQVWAYGSDYYQGSLVKKGVDTAVATKDYGLAKVEGARSLVRSSVSLGKEAVFHPVGFAAATLHTTLDYCDEIVDNYVAEESEGEEDGAVLNDHDSTMLTYVDRVQSVSGRAAHGLRLKGARKLAASRELLAHHIDNFRGALHLAEYMRATADWTGKNVAENVENLRANAVAFLKTVDAHAKKYDIQPEMVLLRFIKTSASLLSGCSQEVLRYTSPYLPTVATTSLGATTAYLHELDETFAGAQTLNDVKEEVLSEAREKLGMAEQVFLTALDRAAEWPPLSWVRKRENGKSSEEGRTPSTSTTSSQGGGAENEEDGAHQPGFATPPHF